MAVETRWFVKTALIFLLLTVCGGAFFVFSRMMGASYPYSYVIVHAHLGIIGFVLNMIVGVAYWMFPRLSSRYPETNGRYNKVWAWASYIGINAGLVLRAISEPAALANVSATWCYLYMVSVVMLVCGVALFVGIIWPRVREVTAPKHL